MTYHLYPHQYHSECVKLLGKRDRRCSGRYMYFALSDPGDKTSDVVFFSGQETRHVYATLTKEDLLTIDHQQTSQVWLENHIFKIFGIRIFSDASNHRTHLNKMRLWRAHPDYNDLPWINGTQFHHGHLVTPVEDLLAQDTVRRTDRTKAKQARKQLDATKKTLLTSARLGARPAEFNYTLAGIDDSKKKKEVNVKKLVAFMSSDQHSVEQKLGVAAWLHRRWLHMQYMNRMPEDVVYRIVRAGWKRFDAMLLEDHGAYVFEPAKQGDK